MPRCNIINRDGIEVSSRFCVIKAPLLGSNRKFLVTASSKIWVI